LSKMSDLDSLLAVVVGLPVGALIGYVASRFAAPKDKTKREEGFAEGRKQGLEEGITAMSEAVASVCSGKEVYIEGNGMAKRREYKVAEILDEAHAVVDEAYSHESTPE